MENDKRNRTPWRWFLGLALVAALLPAAASAQEEVVKVGDLPVLSNAGIYVAIEKGYFTTRRLPNADSPLTGFRVHFSVPAGTEPEKG